MGFLISDASGRSKFMSCAVLLDNNSLTVLANELVLAREELAIAFIETVA